MVWWFKDGDGGGEWGRGELTLWLSLVVVIVGAESSRLILWLPLVEVDTRGMGLWYKGGISLVGGLWLYGGSSGCNVVLTWRTWYLGEVRKRGSSIPLAC